MLYDLLEDDEHLEALVGGMFGPDMQATGGVTKIFKGGGVTSQGSGSSNRPASHFLGQRYPFY